MLKNYPNAQPYLPFNWLNHTQIWLAIDFCNQKAILIKALQQGYNATQYQQFFQECTVYQHLKTLPQDKRAYFATLVEAETKQKENWLALTFYPGVTLKQLIAKNQLDFSVRMAYLIELCTAIDIFHTQGFIHCDIKPSNILIAESQLKLLDFGLSKSRDTTLALSNITAGTPAYMSPEQITGGRVTYQSDYYSLGVVMYEFLGGKKPFFANTLETWALAHCQQPVAEFTHFTPELNEQLSSILNGLLAKLPENRPKNLAPIMQELKNLLKS